METATVQPARLDTWLHFWKTRPFTNEPGDVPQLIRTQLLPTRYISPGASILFLYDYRNDRFVHIEGCFEKMTGYAVSDFLHTGMEVFGQCIHPEDKAALYGLSTAVAEQYYEAPPHLRQNITSSYTFRFRRANSTYFQMLRHDLLLWLDGAHNPRYGLWISSDISYLKTDNRVIATLATASADHSLYLTCKVSAPTAPPEQISRLSMREREIIRLVAQGYSSRQIANQLNLSFHTVTTHKRNIFEKTASHNANTLVGFAIRNGII